jgi:hypothetical protein
MRASWLMEQLDNEHDSYVEVVLMQLYLLYDNELTARY